MRVLLDSNLIWRETMLRCDLILVEGHYDFSSMSQVFLPVGVAYCKN